MRNEENLFLELLGSHATAFMNDGVTFDELKNAFKEHIINLEMDKTCFPWVLSESLLGEIEKTMPKLLKIAEKPRSFVESHNEKVLVESARKISHKAISELSADSKDWYSRTYVSVKPKRINAEISDETLNIYENRVFVSLIKRLDREMYIKRRESVEMLQKAISASSMKEIEDYFGVTSDSSAWSFPFYKSNTFEETDDDNGIEEIENLIKRIEKIDKYISRIKQSNVFKDLRKLRKEHSPILHTNIFLYDKNYKAALELWRSLDKAKFDIQKDVADRVINEEQAEKDYGLFVLMCLLYGFIDMKYEADSTSGKIYHDESDTFIEGKLILRKDGNVFTITGHTKYGYITVTHENKSLSMKEKTYVLHMNYYNFEKNEDILAFDEITENMLNNYVYKNKKKNKENSGKHIVCISLDGSSKLAGILGEKLIRRILSFGDSFSNLEDKDNLIRWGNYQTGFLNLLPQINLANNLLKIERFVSHITINELDINNLLKLKGVCPVCGCKALEQKNANDFFCKKCQHFISSSFHSDCKVDKQRFLWIKPADTKYVEKQKSKLKEGGKTLYSRYQLTQTMFGKYATTFFDVSIDGDTIKTKTICPKCGNILGNS